MASAPLRLEKPDFDHINNIFDELGPVPRLCIDFSEQELSEYKAALNVALTNLTINDLEKLVWGYMGLSMDATSQMLCLVRRLDPIDLEASFAVKVLPITPSIGSRICSQLRNAEHDKQLCLYKRFAADPSTVELADDLFEDYCQQRLSGMNFD
jgi:hypothetical protein